MRDFCHKTTQRHIFCCYLRLLLLLLRLVTCIFVLFVIFVFLLMFLLLVSWSCCSVAVDDNNHNHNNIRESNTKRHYTMSATVRVLQLSSVSLTQQYPEMISLSRLMPRNTSKLRVRYQLRKPEPYRATFANYERDVNLWYKH